MSRKIKNATETWKKMCAVDGEGAVTNQTYQTWFVKFGAGDFSLDDAPWWGRPLEVDSEQIKTLIENNQHYTTWERAGILKISKSKALLVKMNNVSFILWKKHMDFMANPIHNVLIQRHPDNIMVNNTDSVPGVSKF